MKYSIFLVALVSIYSWTCNGQEGYKVEINLTKNINDTLEVKVIIPPLINKKENVFHFPAVIPGVYGKPNYGRLIHDFKAYNQNGTLLNSYREDINSIVIENSANIEYVTYKISDSFGLKLEETIFWPAGTNFEKANFILNAPGYVGYLKGHKQIPYDIHIIRPKSMYASTGLINNNEEDDEIDIFRASTYDKLVDSPIMYSHADTTWIKVSNTSVLVSVYSPNSMINSTQIAESISKILNAQADYLGGQLPVNKYAFLFYFSDEPVHMEGALEHSYSSVYYMQEAPIEQIETTISVFAAHEFFHIVTPLTLHSEEIEDFDFINPKMSKHLWLYESTVEYFGIHTMLTSGIISKDKFLELLATKLKVSDSWPENLSLTEMSSNVLNGAGRHYLNVYHYGVLVCMGLDIKLRQTSRGKYGLKDLVGDLTLKYGKDNAFVDDELFNDIYELTNSEVKEYFQRYVSGSEKLPTKELFQLIGLAYQENFQKKELSLGFDTPGLALYKNKSVIKLNDKEFNKMGQLLGLRTHDILLEINGEKVPEEMPLKRPFLKAAKEKLIAGELITLKVARQSNDGFNEMQLQATCKEVIVNGRHQLKWLDKLSNEQSKISKSWLLE